MYAAAALGKITARFAEKESQFWNSDLQIVDFERVREIEFPIPRPFCRAVALVSDGRKHEINYRIGQDTGMIGMTWGVEGCVVGLDRDWTYKALYAPMMVRAAVPRHAGSPAQWLSGFRAYAALRASAGRQSRRAVP